MKVWDKTGGVSITFVIFMCCIVSLMGKETNKTTRVALSRNVSHLMAKHGDTQATLAKRAGISQSNVYYVVATERNVRLDTVEAIASAYGLSGWHLINPNLPRDLVDSPSLSKLVDSYARTTPEGRAMFDAIAERESEYNNKKPA